MKNMIGICVLFFHKYQFNDLIYLKLHEQILSQQMIISQNLKLNH